MKTLQLTKYQARQALNTYRFANETLSHYDGVKQLERESQWDSKFSNIHKQNDSYYYVRNSKDKFVFLIDVENMVVRPDVEINGQLFSVAYLQGYLNDLAPEQQKESLNSMDLTPIEKYLSKRCGTKIHLYTELKQNKSGDYTLNLFTGNLIDKTGICKAMLKDINIESSIGYSIDYDGTGEQYLYISTFYFQYDHMNGGSNGYEMGRVKWNEEDACFYGYNYETRKYEVI